MTRIMVVDDEALIRQLLTYQLGGAGYDVQVFENGRDALARILIEQPDLVLLDVMMPDMSGWEVCMQIRQYSDVPIIMLTAKSSDMDVVTGLNTGADDYIAKPYNLDKLLARVEAVLRRAKKQVVPATSVASGASSAGMPLPSYAESTPVPVSTGSSSVDLTRSAPPVYVNTVAESLVSSPHSAESRSPHNPAPKISATAHARLGRRLFEARRSYGLSLYQVELDCGIRWEFLQALERGHVDFIPRSQLRQVVRRYSNYLGVDTQEFDTTAGSVRAIHVPAFRHVMLPILAVIAILLLVLFALTLSG